MSILPLWKSAAYRKCAAPTSPMARPSYMAPSPAAKPTSAVVDSIPKGVCMCVPTVGFQPLIQPVVEAKMNTDGAVVVPSVTEKSLELPVPMIGWLMLNTCPVGAPPGMATLKGAVTGLPLTAPRYSSLTPPPLEETQNAPALGAREMPQGFFRVGSRSCASPGRSDTRLVWRKFADSRRRSSSVSMLSRGRADLRAVVRLRGLPPRSHFAMKRGTDIRSLLVEERNRLARTPDAR